jgi:hypothetical protein
MKHTITSAAPPGPVDAIGRTVEGQGRPAAQPKPVSVTVKSWTPNLTATGAAVNPLVSMLTGSPLKIDGLGRLTNETGTPVGQTDSEGQPYNTQIDAQGRPFYVDANGRAVDPAGCVFTVDADGTRRALDGSVCAAPEKAAKAKPAATKAEDPPEIVKEEARRDRFDDVKHTKAQTAKEDTRRGKFDTDYDKEHPEQ